MRNKVLTVAASLALVFLLSGVAFAQETHAGAKQGAGGESLRMIGFALGIGLGLAAGCAALGQSNAIRGALESVARQPEAGGRLQTMMLIGVVFIETLVIFTWVLFFLWGNKFLPA